MRKKVLDYLYDEDYDRLASGKRLDILNRPYSIEYIESMLEYFSDEEEYEKCQIVSQIIKDIRNHEVGYLLNNV